MSETAQRLSMAKLEEWENLKYGMFIHFGLNTFTGDEFEKGEVDAKIYAPDALDVDSWVKLAKDSGMKYAVLTAKHTSGHCLWPSKFTDYTVENSTNKTDVVYEFMNACAKYGIKPGLYYCSWDNHNRFGSLTPSYNNFDWFNAYATQDYVKFQQNQLLELLDTYKGIYELWVDIPRMIPRANRNELYDVIAKKSPETVIVMNNGLTGGNLSVWETWPTDVVTIERCMPNQEGYNKNYFVEGKQYYLPGEVCESIGHRWFFFEDDMPRNDAELLGMYTLGTGRGANFLLDVAPDCHGQFRDYQKEALYRLRENIEKTVGF